MRRVSVVALAAALAFAGCQGEVAFIGGAQIDTRITSDPRFVAPKGTLAQADKVDLLLMIDNSYSMEDKQELLRRSVPDLVRRLVEPNCVDVAGQVVGRSLGGACAAGQLEFAPVTDLHVGVVTSSLGTPGDDGTCLPETNDKARLVTRTADGSPIANAENGFLTFGPNGITDVSVLEDDISSLIGGVGVSGCGIESQLESWYRFLVQPDPYERVVVDQGVARYEGIDFELLAQRRNFLRPDSLLSVVMLTDEDDSTVDPRALRGQGWAFTSKTFPGSTQPRGASAQGTTAPRPTSACASDPLSDDCTSCGFFEGCATGSAPVPANVPCDVVLKDPSCAAQPFLRPDEDELNTRVFQMKRRFGVDPQFPIERYAYGLLSAKIPSSLDEHDATTGDYTGQPSCTNPIYAAALPAGPGDELCELTEGPRSQRLVVLTVIAGAPPELLHPAMTGADWSSLLGPAPMAYDFQGIDPRMVQSTSPRPGLPSPGDASVAPLEREYDTEGKDLQYACTFVLEAPRVCEGDSDCSCTPFFIPRRPICTSETPARQIAAAAYPGIRVFQLTRQLGDNAVASSICPTPQAASSASTTPTFGYRPAMRQLGDRMARSLVAPR